jgi:hypothetical protein
MEVLFRFNMVRDASLSADEVDLVDLTQESSFQRKAAAIPSGAERRAGLHALAHAYIESSSFQNPTAASELLGPLLAVSAAIDGLLDSGRTTRAKVAEALEKALGKSPADYLASDSLEGEIASLKDSILAIKLSPQNHNKPILRLATVLRAYYLVRTFVEDRQFPVDARSLMAIHQRGLKLPDSVLPSRTPLPNRPKPPTIGDRLKDMAVYHGRLSQAIKELRTIRPAGFATVVSEERPEVLPPEKFRPFQLFEQELAIRSAALKTALRASAETVVDRESTRDSNGDNLSTLAAVRVATPYLQSAALLPDTPLVRLGKGARVAVSGRTAFKPVMPGLLGLRLSEKSQQALSSDTQKLLAELSLETSSPLSRTLDVLQKERKKVHIAAQGVVGPMAHRTFRRIGKTSVAVTSKPNPGIYCLAPDALLDYFGASPAGSALSVPTSHADIKPSGMMDLLLVKQQLKGYEAADVSHIANVLKGETNERSHRTRLETESITYSEAERTVVTEQELQTTDRFEMRRESEAAVQEETAVKGSLMVKGKYGPTVEFQVSGEASWQRKTQESERAANEFSREVTQKASEKITERVLRRETLRINRQVEEANLHSFDNTDPAANHLSGVYQFVSKLYEAQVFNYGPRTVYDIMLPEPGAFLLEAFRRRRTAAVELEKPADFDLKPSDLEESTYETLLSCMAQPT